MTVKSRSRNIADLWSAALGVLLIGAVLGVQAQTQQQQQQPPQQQPAKPQPAPQPPPQQQPAKPQPAPQPPPVTPAPAAPSQQPTIPKGVDVPADYIIGPDDVLSVVYWRDKEMTNDVTVRPDGRISLPLLNDIQAAGLTPAQLHDKLVEESKKYIEDPSVTVVVKQINSRKVFITGEVNKPGPYPLSGPTTVLQLLAMAGGFRDYADIKKIVIVRNENGKQVTYPFNYKDVTSRRNLTQNIELKPGDTVIVP